MTKTRADKAKHRRGLLRVLAYFSGVTLVCGVVSIRHARAEYQDQTLLFGRQMLDLAKAANHDVTKIIFNGQPVHVGTSVTQDSPESVLHRYEDYCKANIGQTDDFRDLEKLGEPAGSPKVTPDLSDPTIAALADKAAKVDQNALAKAGYMRSEGKEGGDGAVVCFVKGPKTKATTKDAFASFMSTGELGAIGELRYAYVSKAPSGKTLVLTVWTDSTFNLRDMIPEEGKDAPGEDFAEVPRLPGSSRVMSARAANMPYGVNVYKTNDAPTKALEFYDREMKAAGWFTYDPEMSEGEDKGLGRAYMKNAVVVTLGTSKLPEGNFIAVGLSGVAPEDRFQHAGRGR